MFRLAWPALTENLLTMMVQFVNTAMVGGLGQVATAAVGVNSTPMWLVNGIITSVGVGATALVARMTGADDREGAEEACRQAFLSIIGIAAFFFVVMELIAGLIPVWMGAQPEVYADAARYMRLVALGFIPNFTGVTLGATQRGAGDTRTPMLVAAGTNVMNFIGNLFLIYPTRLVTVGSVSFTMVGAGLGVSGAGISTAISGTLSGLLMFLLIQRKKGRLRLRLKGLRPNPAVLRRIFRVGLPTASERVAINLGQMFYVRLIASLGTAQLAAHHLSITVESLSYMPGYAFGIAATTLVGQALGSLNVRLAKRLGFLSMGAATAVMSLVGLALFIFAPAFIGLLTQDPVVREIGTGLIRICSIEQPFMAVNNVGSAALRGAGDTTYPLVVSLVGMWGVRLGLAWALAYPLGLGVNGAWIAMVADQAVRGAMMYIRFARGKWVMARV